MFAWKKYLLTFSKKEWGGPITIRKTARALPTTYSCSSGHFISLTWLHALVRRGLRIRFNWDYISIKTSFPLEREKAASNFGKGEERRGETDRERERIIDTGSARYLSASVAADKICMFANQEVSGVTCSPTPSANTRLRRLRRAKRASKQRNLWPGDPSK